MADMDADKRAQHALRMGRTMSNCADAIRAAERAMMERAAMVAENQGCGRPNCKNCIGGWTAAAIRKLADG